jgi:DNA-binding CsgD family transcriptional regulator
VTAEIVGRESQLDAVDRFVDGLSGGARGLLIRGAAGIGKTTLWTAALDRLGSIGGTTLICRPAETEIRFAFAGLRDAVVAHAGTIDRLPKPMARALRVALLLETPGEPPVEPGAVEAALLGLVRMLAIERAVVLAIDDVQWLDEATRGAFAYVARRVRDERIGIVATERVEAGVAPTTWIGNAFGSDRVEVVEVPPLSVGATHRLLGARLGLSLPRPRLVRLHELSGGNPFYALELAAAWGAGVGADAGSQLPASLQALLARRLGGLPEDTRRALLAVALSGGQGLTPARLAETLGGSEAETAAVLEPATKTGIITGAREGIRFGHPLLAEAAAQDAPAGDVRDLHERLARSASDPEGRARHLALARGTPDPDVASALDRAAEAAAARGAAIDAAELRRLATAFTAADDPARDARRVDEAEALFIAGDVGATRTLLDEIVPGLVDRELRLRALLLLATAAWYEDASAKAVPIAEQALAEAATDPAWQARIHARLSWLADNDVASAQRHSAAALALLDAERDPALYAFALLNDAYLRLQLGQAADHAAIERGFRLQEEARIWEFSTLPGNWAKAMDDLATARTRLELYLERVRAQGDESSIAQLLGYLAELEAWSGNLSRAATEAAEAIELAEESGQKGYLIQALRHRAVIRVMSGALDEARADSDRALGLAEEIEDDLLLPGALGTRAFVALTDGEAALVDRHCTRAMAILDGIGMRDHVAYRFHADHIEALVALDDLDRAAALLERHRERGGLGPRPWIQVTAARCESLLRAARGDPVGALAAIDEAHRLEDGLEMPFERARTNLVDGQVARRAKRRRRAVDRLQASIDGFEALGATAWADRARRELGRVSIRHGRSAELTEGERSVARLAAEGRTNREVATALYISPKTVETNLARAYAKLGIRSRAELGAVMADHEAGSKT